MDEEKKSDNEILDEFRTLGENLASTLNSIWESPERKRLQSEVEEGLSELNKTLTREVETFRESSTGQRLQADIENIKQRVSSGEAGERAREELRKALQYINTELGKFTKKYAADDDGDEGSSGASSSKEG